MSEFQQALQSMNLPDVSLRIRNESEGAVQLVCECCVCCFPCSFRRFLKQCMLKCSRFHTRTNSGVNFEGTDQLYNLVARNEDAVQGEN